MSRPNQRITLTLPATALARAGKIAVERHVTLSTVVAEALHDGIATRHRTRRAEEVLAAYGAAFSDFNEEERLILDGVDLEPEIG